MARAPHLERYVREAGKCEHPGCLITEKDSWRIYGRDLQLHHLKGGYIRYDNERREDVQILCRKHHAMAELAKCRMKERDLLKELKELENLEICDAQLWGDTYATLRPTSLLYAP